MLIHDMGFYGEISKIFTLYHFDSKPRFPPFLLNVRLKSGVTFVRRCFHDGRLNYERRSEIQKKIDEI